MSLKILKLSDAWSYTAEADNLVRMARELVRRGHQVVVGCSPATPLATRAAEAGLQTRHLPGLRARGNPIALGRAVLAVRRLLRDFDPDLVHAYRSPPHVIAALALRSGARARLIRTRGTMDAPKSNPLNRALYGRRTAVTLVTAEVVRAQCIAAGFDPARIETVYGALELERFDPARADRTQVRAELGIAPDAIVIAHLARLAPVKGHEFLLRALPGLLAREPRARLVLVGPAWPGMREKIEATIDELGLRAQVKLAGKVEDVARVLAAADVGVVASIGSEALSRAALEYMAMRLPVVATRVGSLPELVGDGLTGLLVEPRDSSALEQALGRLADDAALRREMGAAGRAKVEARFTTSAQADRLEAIYSRAAAREYPAAAATTR